MAMDPFISEHLQGVSRTYAIVVPMLPGRLAEVVGLAYLVMRIVDTLEDDPQLSAQERRERFDLLAAALNGDRQAADALSVPAGSTIAEHALMRQAAQVFDRLAALPVTDRSAICTCAQTMRAGVLELLERSVRRRRPYPAVADVSELRDYCYYVAGVVGEMLCKLLADHLKERELGRQHEPAVELGIGLQLVNILKDAVRDAAAGRRYLPPAGGDVSDPITVATALARRCLARGIDFVLAVPATAGGARAFCGLPLAWGGLTLKRVEVDPARGKITRPQIHATIARFEELAGDNEALRSWLTELVISETHIAGIGSP